MTRVLRSLLRGALALLVLAVIVVAVLAVWPIRPTVDPIAPRASTETWTMAGGYRIAYTHLPAEGEARGAPVIYLHGGPGGYIHSSVIAALEPVAATGRDVFLYDQSGSGLSDRRARPRDTDFASHLTDLHEIVVDHLGSERVALIGHSFGGFQAASFAAEHPERIEALVLSAPAEIRPARFDADGNWVNASAYPVPEELEFIDVAETYVQDTSAGNLPLRAQISGTVAILFNRTFAPHHEMDAAMNTLAAGFTRSMVCDEANVRPEEGGAGAYMRMGTNFFPDGFPDRRGAMTRVEAPVLVLQGQCDFIPYAAAYEYVDIFPNAEYRFLEGAGHIAWWDRPDAWSGAIAAFVNAEGGSPGTAGPSPQVQGSSERRPQ